MAKKLNNDDYLEGDYDFIDDFDSMESKFNESYKHFTARRRLEKIREEKELDRILNSSYDDNGYYDDTGCIDNNDCYDDLI